MVKGGGEGNAGTLRRFLLLGARCSAPRRASREPKAPAGIESSAPALLPLPSRATSAAGQVLRLLGAALKRTAGRWARSAGESRGLYPQTPAVPR